MKRVVMILVALAMVSSLCYGGEWKPGSAVTKAEPQISVKLLSAFQGLTEVQKKDLSDKITRGKYKEVVIPNGWKVSEMTYSSHSGQTKVSKNLVADFSQTGPLKGRVYTIKGVSTQFVHVWICNNMATGENLNLIETRKEAFLRETLPEGMKSAEDNPVPDTKTAGTLNRILADMPAEPEHLFQKDAWDLYIGGGNYISVKDGGDNNGQYGWSKFRYRPWWIESENSLIGIGLFGFMAGGSGVADKDYDYSWKEKVVGLTAKALLPHRDFDFDLGVGRLENRGEWEDELINKQVDDIILFSAHGNFYKNRDLDGSWFPKAEANLEFRLPLSMDVKIGDDEADNKVIEVCLTQWLYDLHHGSFNFTPGFNFGGGYEWYSDHKAFVKVGPALEISSHGEVLAGISLLNYKFQEDDGQWAPISAYVSIDGIWRAWKSREKKVSTASKKVIEECSDDNSKLLRNPADFLK